VAQAIPAGSRRCADQRAALRALAADPELAQRRADFGHHVAEVYRFLIRHADWRTALTVPGRANVCRAVVRSCTGQPISASTFKRCRAWLEEHGYLGTVTGGWTPMLSAAVLTDPEARNLAPVYVVTIPRRPRPDRPERRPARLHDGSNEPLPLLPKARVRTHARGCAREDDEKQNNEDHASRGLTSKTSAQSRWSLRRRPENRAEGQSAAEALQDHHRVLARISAAYVRHLARPFVAAGWTPADVGHALNYEFGGAQHRFSMATVGNAGAWARARLARWLGPDGVPLPSASQQRAARDDAARAQSAEQQTRTAARRDGAAAAAAAARRGAALARELLPVQPSRGFRPALPDAAVPPAGGQTRAPATRPRRAAAAGLSGLRRVAGAGGTAGPADPAPYAAGIRAKHNWVRHPASSSGQGHTGTSP
jgi:hypothetical protein